MDIRALVIMFLAVVIAPSLIMAAPVTSLSVLIPSCLGPCPGNTPPIRTVDAGLAYNLSVFAMDDAGIVNPSYTGIVSFSSTDPLAVLPPTYTFTPSDEGVHLFLANTILRTPGPQTIQVTDRENAISGTWEVTVIVTTSAASIPATSTTTRIALAVLIATTGFWLLSRRS